jgi:tRNA threonylcarbamoyladenosine biosynthesis protein TsaE
MATEPAGIAQGWAAFVSEPSSNVVDLHFETHSAEETIAAGRAIAALLIPGLSLILRGDLGAGKTTLVKGIAEELGAAEAEEVTSPTFTLVHQYEGTLHGKPVELYHLDLYRLEEERELLALGLDEMIAEGNIVLIEWGEKFPGLVARAHGYISLSHQGGDERSIHLRYQA